MIMFFVFMAGGFRINCLTLFINIYIKLNQII